MYSNRSKNYVLTGAFFLTVCDVLPLLLHANSDLPSKQLYRFLHKSTEFYLGSLMSKNFGQVRRFSLNNKLEFRKIDLRDRVRIPPNTVVNFFGSEFFRRRTQK